MEQCRKSCSSPLHKPSTSQLLRKTCLESKGVATKILRIAHLSQLERFYKNSKDYDFRVIQLVRDPRSMQSSRIKLANDYVKLGWGEVGFIAAQLSRLAINCRDGVTSFEDFQKYQWIRDKTMFVRYEDMAMDPFRYAEQIYDFLGLEFDEKTRENFIAATTHKKRKRRESESERIWITKL